MHRSASNRDELLWRAKIISTSPLFCTRRGAPLRLARPSNHRRWHSAGRDRLRYRNLDAISVLFVSWMTDQPYHIWNTLPSFHRCSLPSSCSVYSIYCPKSTQRLPHTFYAYDTDVPPLFITFFTSDAHLNLYQFLLQLIAWMSYCVVPRLFGLHHPVAL